MFAGQSINPKLAGLIGRHGPQNKQPFTVAFFKATEVHLRSIRSTGGKQRSQNRSKSPKNQEAFRVSNIAGAHRGLGMLFWPWGWFLPTVLFVLSLSSIAAMGGWGYSKNVRRRNGSLRQY